MGLRGFHRVQKLLTPLCEQVGVIPVRGVLREDWEDFSIVIKGLPGLPTAQELPAWRPVIYQRVVPVIYQRRRIMSTLGAATSRLELGLMKLQVGLDTDLKCCRRSNVKSGARPRSADTVTSINAHLFFFSNPTL